MEPKNTGFTVVESGNRRGNVVSKEEVKQGIVDMASYFETRAKGFAATLKDIKPATADDLTKLKDTIKAPVPLGLEVLLTSYNGGFLLKDNYKTLSVEQILEALDLNQINMYWKKNYIPFAVDEDNNYLCLEHENGNETKVVAWCADMGVIEDVSDGLGLLIEKVRDGLLKKKIQYVEGAGLVEDSS